jgi:hypothetical protein
MLWLEKLGKIVQGHEVFVSVLCLFSSKLKEEMVLRLFDQS